MSDDTPAAPKKKGGKMKKIIFFVLLPLLLIGGGIGAGVYAAGSGMVGHKEGEKPKPDRPKLVVKEGKDGPTELPDNKQPDPEIYKSTYVPMEQAFTSNLRDTDGYLQVGLGLSTFYDEEFTVELKDAEMPVRSAVLEVLATQTADSLNTPEGKAALRKQLKVAINHVLEKRVGFGGVDDVYFTSFIIQ